MMVEDIKKKKKKKNSGFTIGVCHCNLFCGVVILPDAKCEVKQKKYTPDEIQTHKGS
jgi:hypothetical protein